MMRTLRILGKRGRITIPYEIRQKLGFRPNDELSFQIMDDRTVLVRRERLCNATRGGKQMKEDLRILMVEPHKAPYEASVPHELFAMQQTVGGLIEVVRNGDGTLLVCNEEGKLLGLPLNRTLRDENGEIYDAIAGTFFICGAPADSENFTSLTDEQIDYWLRRFAKPEFFVNVNGQIICVPVEEPCQ